jgi:hypothetical protein
MLRLLHFLLGVRREKVAQHVGLDRSHLARACFRRDHVLQRRSHAAQQLLSPTSLTLTLTLSFATTLRVCLGDQGAQLLEDQRIRRRQHQTAA